LVGPSTARRPSGSLAKDFRVERLSFWAPFCQASKWATTWSTWTAEDVSCPRLNLMACPVYGSDRVPLRTRPPVGAGPERELLQVAPQDVVAGVAAVAVIVVSGVAELVAVVAGLRSAPLNGEQGEGGQHGALGGGCRGERCLGG
jgi:hypothetical protein